jgi:hypothetical protein
MADASVCPGCGLARPASGAALNRKVNASPECWQVYGEVTGFELDHLVELGKLHQLTVDTYGAQHGGGQSSGLGLAYSLVGLFLALERGAGGDQVRALHQRMGRPDDSWPTFVSVKGAVTVLDVANAGARAESVRGHAEAIERWAQSVWEAAKPQHEEIAGLAARVQSRG